MLEYALMALLDVIPNHWLLLSNSREKKNERHLKSPLVDTEESLIRKKIQLSLDEKESHRGYQTFLHRASHSIHLIVPKRKCGQHSDCIFTTDCVRVLHLQMFKEPKNQKKKQ